MGAGAGAALAAGPGLPVLPLGPWEPLPVLPLGGTVPLGAVGVAAGVVGAAVGVAPLPLPLSTMAEVSGSLAVEGSSASVGENVKEPTLACLA